MIKGGLEGEQKEKVCLALRVALSGELWLNEENVTRAALQARLFSRALIGRPEGGKMRDKASWRRSAGIMFRSRQLPIAPHRCAIELPLSAHARGAPINLGGARICCLNLGSRRAQLA